MKLEVGSRVTNIDFLQVIFTILPSPFQSNTMGTSSGDSEEPCLDTSVVEMDNATSVLHKIANLYAEQLMSDIILVVGENRYPAHRVILCASSEVFQVMLMNPEWNECKKSVIELKEETLCAEVFPQFLKYLYVGQIRISLQSVMPMLALADKYNIKDLVQLCVSYMLKHNATASTQGFLISWLQYAINFHPYHQEVTKACQKFMKWNLNLVADSADFVDLDVNYLVLLLQQNDLVLGSEFELYVYLERWLMHKKVQLGADDSLSAEDRAQLMQQYIELTVVHIRFAMMCSTKDLASLLLRPIVQCHKAFFVDRISIGLCYHSGKKSRLAEIRRNPSDRLQFTPRLYTTDTNCFGLTMNEFQKIEDYQNFGGCLFGKGNLQDGTQEEQPITWELDFYPRGIRYNRAKIINVYNFGSTADTIPEAVLKTVRLRVTFKGDLQGEHKFKVRRAQVKWVYFII